MNWRWPWTQRQWARWTDPTRWESWLEEVVWPWVEDGLWLAAGLVVGWLLGRLVGRWSERAAQPLGPGRATLVGRLVTWGLYAAGVVVALLLAGVPIEGLMTYLAGAAGIVGVALGFASQTSATNVISGLFLLGERPFEEGDMVRIDQVTGVVIGVDMLSVKIRTFDNTFVRVPNETVMKATIVNLSRFPIRRMDVVVRVRPGTDLERVRTLLTQVVESDPEILVEPSPGIQFAGLVDGGVEIQLSAWCRNEIFFETRAKFGLAMMARLEGGGIEVVGSRRDVRVEPDSIVSVGARGGA
jgi:small-conductance mechanosensitive channel